MSEEDIIHRCQTWVKQVVVGLNFCPFAKPVVESGAIRYAVVGEQAVPHALQAVADECLLLKKESAIETSLLILPVGFESFNDYLDLVAYAEELLVTEGYDGEFQLATFHPDYCFDGEVYDDAANFTNRSPYPMLHILREQRVEEALAGLTRPDNIPNRNIEFARQKGTAYLSALLERCSSSNKSG